MSQANVVEIAILGWILIATVVLVNMTRKGQRRTLAAVIPFDSAVAQSRARAEAERTPETEAAITRETIGLEARTVVLPELLDGHSWTTRCAATTN